MISSPYAPSCLFISLILKKFKSSRRIFAKYLLINIWTDFESSISLIMWLNDVIKKSRYVFQSASISRILSHFSLVFGWQKFAIDISTFLLPFHHSYNYRWWNCVHFIGGSIVSDAIFHIFTCAQLLRCYATKRDNISCKAFEFVCTILKHVCGNRPMKIHTETNHFANRVNS